MHIELCRSLCHIAAFKNITAERPAIVGGIFIVKVNELFKLGHNEAFGKNAVAAVAKYDLCEIVIKIVYAVFAVMVRRDL